MRFCPGECRPLQRKEQHYDDGHSEQLDVAGEPANRATLYSPMTMPTTALVPAVESQSLQPTMKPAYSPMARRAKLY